MIQVAKLNKASSFFYLFAFITARLQYLPIPIATSIFKAISLGFNLIGCCIWLVASQFYPEHEIKEEEWYGFAQFKMQYSMSAILGIVATIISFCGLLFPPLLIPAAWLFFASNVLWSIGEYHKLKSPPLEDPLYSQSYQKKYVQYAITMTLIGLTTAIGTTLLILFPPITIAVLIISTLICGGLGLLAAEFWLEFNLGDHKKDHEEKESYQDMCHLLGIKEKPALIKAPEPYHANSPLLSSNSNEYLVSKPIEITLDSHLKNEYTLPLKKR